ncbi:hypothetical protein CALCODRAFT_183556 [Calocera cornea HHB12733]|uniref:NB-ARC domain-containing protein n=1 Tax=Calocera cornea HHB12733 TaxID=1353952 RepID=A0A165CAZ6_9BASI|nr:hypothetical protein CALCODRAFT_183556 [Calocera cornea HHB12733]
MEGGPRLPRRDRRRGKVVSSAWAREGAGDRAGRVDCGASPRTLQATNATVPVELPGTCCIQTSSGQLCFRAWRNALRGSQDVTDHDSPWGGSGLQSPTSRLSTNRGSIAFRIPNSPPLPCCSPINCTHPSSGGRSNTLALLQVDRAIAHVPRTSSCLPFACSPTMEATHQMSGSSLAPKGGLASLSSAFQKLKLGATSVAAPLKHKTEEILLRVSGIYEMIQGQREEYEGLTEQLIFLTTRVIGGAPNDGSISEDMRHALDVLQGICNEIDAELHKHLQTVGEPAVLPAHAAQGMKRLQKKLDKQSHHLTLVGTSDYMRDRGRCSMTIKGYNRRLRPPPKPAIFYGRDEIVQSIVDLLLKGDTCRIALLGPGGIGKTSTVATVLHDTRVEERFQGHLFFFSCEGIISASGIILAVAGALALQHGNGVREALIDFCASCKHVLLVLDNLETVWDSDDQAQVEEFLADCVSIPTMSLIVTMRGAVRPGGVDWNDAILDPLGPLSLEAARSMWIRIAKKSDSRLDELLQLLDGLPLAINLMAHHGQSMTPTELIEAYDQEHTSMLSRGKPSRLTSLEISIELSLSSPTLQREPSARTILSALSILPNGILRTEVGRMLPCISGSGRAVRALMQVGLAHDTAGRLSALAPIRDFIHERYPPVEPCFTELRDYFARLANFAEDLKTATAKKVVDTLRAEYGNVNAVLLRSWCASPGPDIAKLLLRATTNLASFSLTAAYGDSIPLLTISMMVLTQLGDTEGAADGAMAMAKCLCMLNRYDDAFEKLQDAKVTYVAMGNRVGAAHCTKGMGTLLGRKSPYVQGIAKLEDAQAMYKAIGHWEGVADCSWSMGEILRTHHRYGEAMEKLEDAKAMYEAIANPLGVANCAMSIGDTLRRRNHHDEATEKIEQARVTFEAIGARYSEAWCFRYLALVFIDQGQKAEAETMVERAVNLFLEIKRQDEADSCRALLSEVHAIDGSTGPEVAGSVGASSTSIAEAAREGAEWRAC